MNSVVHSATLVTVDPYSGPAYAIYVVWHPASDIAEALAHGLFRALCADPRYPARRGLGIPVRFRTSRSGADVPAAIPLSGVGRTGVVVIADANLVVDPAWRNYVSDVVKAANRDLVIPVSLTPVHQLPVGLAARRSLVLTNATESVEPSRSTELLNRVMHDVALKLDERSRQVKVFISHAKLDGVAIARVVRRYFHEVAGLDDFFDAADVSFGSPLADEIVAAAGSAIAMLAIQTDSYASREWCRLEVLEAKRRRVPIVVLTAVQVGEHRAFPYLGNVPVVRWRDESSLPVVSSAILREVLRCRYFPQRVTALCRLYGLDPEREVFAHPPELLTALLHRFGGDGRGRARWHYLYPDPPLGTEELDLLQMMDPSLLPVTPTTLWAL